MLSHGSVVISPFITCFDVVGSLTNCLAEHFQTKVSRAAVAEIPIFPQNISKIIAMFNALSQVMSQLPPKMKGGVV